MKTKLLTTILTVLLLTGCTTVFQSIITVTGVVDAAMKNWASLSVKRQTTHEFDLQIIAAHDKYRQAAAVAQASLNLYKMSNDQKDFVLALQAARDGAGPLIELIASIVSPSDAVKMKLNLAKASKP